MSAPGLRQPRRHPGEDFAPALTGQATDLQLDDRRVLPLHTARWRRPAAGDDRWMLDRCRGRTLDLGCGPGRLVAALARRGVPALGADTSAVALRHCRARGAPAVRGDVFDDLPGEGRWRTVLLADGNIGIGGDPARLLRRAHVLLRPGGEVIVETATSGSEQWRGNARLRDRHGSQIGEWFPWATLGLTALAGLVAAAGLDVRETYHGHGRFFARLRAAAPPAPMTGGRW
ncbi:bifunctional 2-polyprenyl-6-hydroxyphenol methylase/3-demethylubiquinol 3-O-methyltransferase UbiG [Amycolatopsis sp. CA-128772]|uniref:class I SAM-dependent methyltransferase n=1 Tax=Amycolatopsis sp. CA-128772 TaxID=2073159 RepID=UPI001E4B2FC6|nr:class I SAM-dependent methyltransferase [Amycolatopsis sp. CA-128772]